MRPTPRRTFLKRALAAAPLSAFAARIHAAGIDPELENRIRGLLVGSALGDALGGPIEFQPPDAVHRLPDAPKIWQDHETLDAPARATTASRLRLRSYHELRPKPESYGQWNTDSLPGTVTDDTRHKLILLLALHRAEDAGKRTLDRASFAQAHLDWPRIPAVAGRADYRELASDWLEEWQFAARWILGERDPSQARPPERMWQGLPTCCGQMTLPPLAAIYPGRPSNAYRAAYQLAFFDNGIGKDLNAALVAGLATALATPVIPANHKATWAPVLDAMRDTDPYGYSKIRWSTRPVTRWLDLALRFAREAGGRPARLFASMEREFLTTTKWEAQVPFVVMFGCLALAEYDPLAALQLTLEWGHDSDSYAQLLAAFAGALYGPSLFPQAWIQAVNERLKTDFQVDLTSEARFLLSLARRADTEPVIREIP